MKVIVKKFGRTLHITLSIKHFKAGETVFIHKKESDINYNKIRKIIKEEVKALTQQWVIV